MKTTFYRDADGDGYGNLAVTTQACTAPAGYVANSTDCNDADAAVHPGATEVCNGVDDNCDGSIDEGVTTTFYRDADGDGYGNLAVTTQACTAPAGYVANSTDCNDADAAVHPGATEVCNGVDDNCDGSIDEGVTTTFYRDADGDGYGNPAVSTQACSQPAGYVTNSTDCNDSSATVHPGAAEVCNGIDDDCNSGTLDGSADPALNDNNACTADACVGGTITHTAANIDDGNACTVDYCDPVTGNITHTNNNVPPGVTSTSGPNPLALQGNSATVTANFTDADTFNTHTCTIDWDDGQTTNGTVSETNGSGTCTGTHSYAQTGVYSVTFTITDSCGGTGTGTFQYVVIYDPNAGFVTGGGWINSPVGAYTANPSLTGKANFGFVSKYVKGKTTPTGNTEFQFQAANFNFKSTSYDWLVISGAKAQYKGYGTINGAGNYSFILTAIDGALLGSNKPDTFRLKVFDQNQGNAVIYDNLLNAPDSADPTTTLGGGSIVIHK